MPSVENTDEIHLEFNELSMSDMKKVKEKVDENELIKMSIHLLTKKFGILSKELKDKIEKSDYFDLEVMVGEIFSFENILGELIKAA